MPFFNTKADSLATWWCPTITGDYATDRNTGRNYARMFAPQLLKNYGPVAFSWIVQGIVDASKPRGRGLPGRTRDNVASGFLQEIAGMLQVAMVNLARARRALDDPEGYDAHRLRETIDSGTVLYARPSGSLCRHPGEQVDPSAQGIT